MTNNKLSHCGLEIHIVYYVLSILNFMLEDFVEYITLKYFKDYEIECKELVITLFHALSNDSYAYVYVVKMIITYIHKINTKI
jgi:hypothetical protein